MGSGAQGDGAGGLFRAGRVARVGVDEKGVVQAHDSPPARAREEGVSAVGEDGEEAFYVEAAGLSGEGGQGIQILDHTGCRGRTAELRHPGKGPRVGTVGEPGERVGHDHGGDALTVVGTRDARPGAPLAEKSGLEIRLRGHAFLVGEVDRFLLVFDHVVDAEGRADAGDVVTHAFVGPDVDGLHFLAELVAVSRLKLRPVGRTVPLEILDIDGARGLFAHACELGHDGAPVGEGGTGHPGQIGEGGHPVMELRWLTALGIGGDGGGPADEGGHADAALPEIALDAIVGAEGLEEAGIVDAHIVEAGGVLRAVVGGEDDERIIVETEVFEELDKVSGGVVEAAHHGGIALGELGPGLAVAGCVGVLRMETGVPVAGGGVDHLPRRAEPLHAAVKAEAGRVVAGRGEVGGCGHTQAGVGRELGEVDEEGLVRVGSVMVDDPLFCPRGEQIGGVALGEISRDVGEVVVEGPPQLEGIVEVSILVRNVSKKVVKAAVEWVAGKPRASLQAPFADDSGGVAGFAQDSTEGVGVG